MLASQGRCYVAGPARLMFPLHARAPLLPPSDAKSWYGSCGTSPQTRAQVEVARLGEGMLGGFLYQMGLGSSVNLFAAFHLDVREDGEKGCRRKGLLFWCG